MGEFMFDEYLKQLNKGVLLKDTNLFTQFSKNNELIIAFFSNYLAQESINLQSDLKKLFDGMITHATNPQIVLASLKVLS